jgi:hypothetical protein
MDASSSKMCPHFALSFKVKDFGTCRPALVHPSYSSALAKKTWEQIFHICQLMETKSMYSTENSEE